MNDLGFALRVDEQADFHEQNLDRLNRLWRRAALVIGLCAGLFLLWGLFAPLTKAAIAPGIVEVEGRRRVVQNLEGGIIAEILVRDGQRVERGQPLIRLDSVQSGAAAQTVRDELLALLAERQRLIDERDGGALTNLPFELEAARGDPRTLEMLRGQADLLRSRRESLNAQRAVLNETAAQARYEISGLTAQLAAAQAQASSLRAEIRTAETLVAEQLERRSRLDDLRRQLLAAEGQVGQIQGRIGTARRQIAQAGAQSATLSADRRDQNEARMREIDIRLNELREQGRAADDIQQRRAITAPSDGRVVELRFSTIGGVVRPGDPILDIVPDRQEMVVAARVRPIDIENVHAGLAAEIRLVPFTGRDAPLLNGVVENVSADSITTRDGSETYYLARVRIADADLATVQGQVVSGMPAEVFVLLKKRSLLQALFAPLTDSFRRALRE